MKERKIFIGKFNNVVEHKNTKYQGYVFTDEYNNTRIICYGESKRKSLIEMFSKNSTVVKL
jgi:hypothetical protein